MDEEQQEKSVSKPGKFRVCNVCGKDFSSGKALGGHMRIHMVEKMNNPKPKSRRFYSGSFNQCKDGEDKPICFACGKKFPSMKSLFGHMRSHPERGWRGIHPPSSNLSAQSSTVSDSNRLSSDTNDQIASVFSAKSGSRPGNPDLLRFVSSWTVTAKRGRKSLGSIAHSGSDHDLESELVHEAFMMLADKNWLNSSVPKDKKSVATHPASSNFVVNEADLSQENLQNCRYSAKIEHERVEEETNKPEEERSVCIEMMGNLKKRKKRKLRDLESISMRGNTLDKYKCTGCNKSFSTHQALGGHMSRHNKMIKISQNNSVDEATASGNTSISWVGSYHDKGDNSDHCIPRQEFKISPAVGSTEAALSSVTCDKTSPSSTMSRKLLDFDLNELPPMDEDEERIVPEGVAVGPLAVYASA